MKKLKIEDYHLIEPYLDMANYEGYNSNFVTMIMWNHEYHIEYEIHDHYLVMLHNYKGIYFWAMPFTTPEYYQDAIDFMINYSFEHHFDFMIDCAIESFVEIIKPLYKDKLLFERTPFNDDYIYDCKMLQTLSGKKMQKRRNHYNAFLKEYPNYEYRDLDMINDFDTIFECINRWETDKNGLSESMTSEVRGIMSLLSSQHCLDFEMGGIFIDQHLEAFIIASRLKHETVQIHVEKANKAIRGLYPAILKEMLSRHYSEEKYVNREEDMGLENLKKSKQSLHPIKMIHKYRITLKNFRVEKAKDSDIHDIKDLWLNNFNDEDEKTTEFYFQNYYKKDLTYLLKNNNQLISMMQIVPFQIVNNHQVENNYFILGVCTQPAYEKQGCMSYLMNHVLKKYSEYPIYLQAYTPEIYHKFGFFASHYLQVITVDTSIFHECTWTLSEDKSLLQQYYDLYTAQFNGYHVRDSHYWDLFVERCKVFNQQIIIFKDLGYLIYSEKDNNIIIYECVYLNHHTLKDMLCYFKDKCTNIILMTDLKVNIPGEKKLYIEMMCNTISHNKINKDMYINEVY